MRRRALGPGLGASSASQTNTWVSRKIIERSPSRVSVAKLEYGREASIRKLGVPETVSASRVFAREGCYTVNVVR
jgi:hypothetical protein